MSFNSSAIAGVHFMLNKFHKSQQKSYTTRTSSSYIISPNLQKHLSAGLTISFETILMFLNTLTILTVVWVKTKLERTNLDLTIMTVSIFEVLSVLIPGPMWLSHYITSRWLGGNILCNIYQTSSTALQFMTLLLVAFMCLERTAAMTKMYRKMESNQFPSGATWLERIGMKNVVIAVSISTCISLLVANLSAILKSIFNRRNVNSQLQLSSKLCIHWLGKSAASWIDRSYIITIISLIGFTMALVFTCNCVLFAIWRVFASSVKNNEAENETSELASSAAIALYDQDNRPTRQEDNYVNIFNRNYCVIFLISLVFMVTWIPSLISAVLVLNGVRIPSLVVFYVSVSTTLSGIFQPAIYFCCLPSFRDGYREIIYRVGQFSRCLALPKESSPSHEPSTSQSIRREETTQFMLSTAGAGVQTALRDSRQRSVRGSRSMPSISLSRTSNQQF